MVRAGMTDHSRSDVLAAATTMGAVTLHVEHLARVLGYYTHGVGLDVLAESDGRVVLGRGNQPVLVLEQTPQLARAAQGSAGLYHSAIVFDTEAALASAVYSIARKFPQSFTGSSDHLVSNAFYFDDPEGNGLELYWDRPREAWTTVNGEIRMGTEWLDPNAFLQQHLTEEGAANVSLGDASIGHVHLQVGDIPTARHFYADVLGFEPTIGSYPGAFFVAAGGYHHHIGMNTWRSAGAGHRAPALGLGEVAITVPTTDEVLAVADRLRTAGLEAGHDGRELITEDPWGNQVRIAVG